MRYIDKTQHPPVENFYPLHVIKQIITAETGRILGFLDSLEERVDYSSFSLARFPEPVGFTLVAAKPIMADSTLFSYGGETLTKKEAAKKNLNKENDDNAYLLNTANENSPVEVTQDAKDFGGFGALLPHLPSIEFINEIGLSPALVQTENVTPVLKANRDNQLRIFMVATKNIQPGTILGFDYGLNYWVERKTTPCFFVRERPEISRISVPFPRIALLTPEGSPRFDDATKPEKFVLLMMTFASLVHASDCFKKDSIDTATASGKEITVLINSVISVLGAHMFVPEKESDSPAYNGALLFVPASKVGEVPDTKTPGVTQKR